MIEERTTERDGERGKRRGVRDLKSESDLNNYANLTSKNNLIKKNGMPHVNYEF